MKWGRRRRRWRWRHQGKKKETNTRIEKNEMRLQCIMCCNCNCNCRRYKTDQTRTEQKQKPILSKLIVFFCLPFQKSSNHFFFLITNKSIIRKTITSIVQIIFTITNDEDTLWYRLYSKYRKKPITDIILCATPDFIPYPAWSVTSNKLCITVENAST